VHVGGGALGAEVVGKRFDTTSTKLSKLTAACRN